MATTYVPKFLKRTASQAQFEAPVAKKPAPEPQADATKPAFSPQKSSPVKSPPPTPSARAPPRKVRLPRLKWHLQQQQRQHPGSLDQCGVQTILSRSIELALKAVGFEAVELDALEALRADTEEYMAHFLATVRQLMFASRRTGSTPDDYLQALHIHQLSLRSLLPHLKPPVFASNSQFRIVTEAAQDEEQNHLRLLETFWNAAAESDGAKFVPNHFPQLPSKHTYKATAILRIREDDPRKIREKAAEEGRLGEEALRKLVGAASDSQITGLVQTNKKRSPKEQQEDMWRKTMQSIGVEDDSRNEASIDQTSRSGQTKATSWTGRIGSAVNSEKIYWRTPKRD